MSFAWTLTRASLGRGALGEARFAAFGEAVSEAFAFEGEASSLSALLAEDAASVSAKLTRGADWLSVDGEVFRSDTTWFAGTLGGSVRDLGQMLAFAGLESLPNVPAEFEMEVQLGQTLGEVKGQASTLGQGDLEIDLGYARAEGLQVIGTLRAETLDLAADTSQAGACQRRTRFLRHALADRVPQRRAHGRDGHRRQNGSEWRRLRRLADCSVGG